MDDNERENWVEILTEGGETFGHPVTKEQINEALSKAIQGIHAYLDKKLAEGVDAETYANDDNGFQDEVEIAFIELARLYFGSEDDVNEENPNNGWELAEDAADLAGDILNTYWDSKGLVLLSRVGYVRKGE